MKTTTQDIQTNRCDTASPTNRIRHVTPAVAIFEDGESFTIEAEMPGVAKDGVHVTLENGELTILGHKTSRPAGTRLYGEAADAVYRRVFDLDPTVDTEGVTARMEQGMLTLSLPKARDKQPRRISINN